MSQEQLRGWCAYVGGIVAHWVKSDPKAIERLGDDGFEAAIAGIIERRLWAMPKPACPAPAASVSMPTTEDEAAAMQMIGYAWLRDNAPHRLTQPAALAQAGVPDDVVLDAERYRTAKARGYQFGRHLHQGCPDVDWLSEDAIDAAILAAAPKEGAKK